MTALLLAVILAGSGAAQAAVVVELFTSQGCSSCPGADALLSAWGGQRFNQHSVLPLSYDVDYWDYLGWKDVFGQPDFSRRQRRYAAKLGVGVYTPQAVVAGRQALVGSDAAALERAVARFAGEPASHEIIVKRIARDRLSVAVKPAAAAPGNRRVVMLAFFERGLKTKVAAGENRGSELLNDFVVRRLVEVGRMPESRQAFDRVVEEAWDRRWRLDQTGAAAFVQDGETLRMLGAAWVFPLERGSVK